MSSAGGRSVNAAAEDILPAPYDDSFGGAVCAANDVRDDETENT